MVYTVKPCCSCANIPHVINPDPVFSKLDANSGFWQIPLSPRSHNLTTFIWSLLFPPSAVRDYIPPRALSTENVGDSSYSYYPQGNGEAEQAVGTVKRLLEKKNPTLLSWPIDQPHFRTVTHHLNSSCPVS